MNKIIILILLPFISGEIFANNLNNALDVYNKGDEEMALTMLLPLAKSGSARAQFEVGKIYSKGKSETDTISFGKAIYWLQKAAEQRFLKAQYNLAILYDKGIYDKGTLVRDGKKAVYWYQQAANAGVDRAQDALGMKYHKGEGVPLDHEKAFSLFKKAAEQGYPPAQFNLGSAYFEGLGVKKNVQKGILFWMKSARNGDLSAQFNLGTAHEEGKHVKQDINKAIFWFKKGAEQGDAKLQYSLGRLYMMHMPRNSNAEYWTKKAARQGISWAYCNLALIYAEGMGVRKDLVSARQWAKKGDALGVSQCSRILNSYNLYLN